MKEAHNHHPYRQLLLMSVLSFVAMFVLMYAMVDRWTNVYPNLNQFYMSALMAAAMVLIELGVMRSMYPAKRTNLLVVSASLGVLVLAWVGIRAQSAIGDHQFLASMIPHHGGAVLMCKKASLNDPELITLCRRIVDSQQEEINQMKGVLKRTGS